MRCFDEKRDERERWNQKYSEAIGTDRWTMPDPFLLQAFSQYVAPLFPHCGTALDLAGSAGRHAIWLAKQGWEVTLIDISDTGVEQARQNAGPLGSHIRFAVDDLTHFQASQMQFDMVIVFFFLERNIFKEIVKAIKPGGVLIYKTHTVMQVDLPGGPKNSTYLLQPRELLELASGLDVLDYNEEVAKKATAKLVARKI